MRILIAHNRYQQAGGEDQVVRTEAAMLVRQGHTVEMLEFDNDAISGLAGQISAAVNSVFSPSSYRRVQQTIRSFRPDMLHVHNFLPTLSPAVFFAAQRDRVPVVQTLHNYRLICANGTLYREGKPCERCVEQNSFLPGAMLGCYRDSRSGSAVVGGTMALHARLGTWQHRVDRFIALTDFAATKFSHRRIPADRLRVKPNFAPDRGVGVERERVALYVGRLSEEKGIETLLAADAAHVLPMPIVILGDGPLREKVHAACARPGSQLIAVGRRSSDEVLARMKRAAVLVLPSVCYEGFPMSVVEALSVGLPVIASNHGGLPEIVPHGGCGLLYKPGEPDALVGALRSFCAMPTEQKSQMRITSRKRYIDRYSESVNYAQLMQIYAEASAAAAEPYQQTAPFALGPAASIEGQRPDVEFGR